LLSVAVPGGRSGNVRNRPAREEVMGEGLLQPVHLLIIFGIALLVFGPKKLPELGKGLGESIRGFKNALRGDEAEEPSRTESNPALPPKNDPKS
jgi:sec-independent protein translocase protein TatA